MKLSLKSLHAWARDVVRGAVLAAADAAGRALVEDFDELDPATWHEIICSTIEGIANDRPPSAVELDFSMWELEYQGEVSW